MTKQVVESKKEVKGRKIKEDGLIAKKRFAADCAKKGMTRPQTIEALLTKYQKMRPNYAKTMVYSYLKEDGVKFVEAKRGKKKADKPSTPKKKEVSTTTPKKKTTSEKKPVVAANF